VEVREVWGIGRNIAETLHSRGIRNALQLKQADPDWVRKRFSVITLRTVLELGGMSCLPVESGSDAQKGMMVTRCFGRPVAELSEMKEAAATHTSRLAEKLRQEGLATKVLIVSMRTNRFADSPQYEASREARLDTPTNSTDLLLPPALQAAEAIFKSGFQYYKAGVYAPELIETDLVQTSLFDDPASPKSQRLMQALDQINHQLGSGSVKYGAVGLKQEWRTRIGYPSKRYTTCWNELLVVKT
ncbi:MAG: DUF4113 domain-containing protein, partial [Kovacikia sp.]